MPARTPLFQKSAATAGADEAVARNQLRGRNPTPAKAETIRMLEEDRTRRLADDGGQARSKLR